MSGRISTRGFLRGGSRLAGVAIVSACVVASGPVSLENAWVRVTVDPLRAGAVTGMAYKNASTFPFIAEKGAGIAGTGTFFAPLFEVGGGAVDLPAMQVLAQDRRSMTLSAPLSALAPGLFFERRIWMGEQQSGFTIDDVIRNESAHDLQLRVGGASRQQSEPWRLTDRFWIGDETNSIESHTPAQKADPVRLQVAGGSFFWRQIEQYGVGYLCRVKSLPSAVNMSADMPAEQGNPVHIAWRSREITVRAHARLTWESLISIDEGGGAPDQRNAFAPVLVRSDAPRAGRSGQRMHAFATVVSAEPRLVRITVSTGREHADSDVALVPGKLARLPLAFTPAGKGDLPIRVRVTESGKELAAASAHALIDGDAASETWKTFSAAMPEEHYRGSWEEIGAQLARNNNRIGPPTSIAIDAREPAASAAALSFYKRRFPFYTELLAGVAKVAGLPPSRLGLVNRAAREAAACMNVAFYGPDGPINAFSKERSGMGFKGLGYVQVVPAKGYPFHIYMNVGINSEGLSTSGATLNEDEQTRAADFQALDEWKRSGKHVMPPAVSMWMLLAMCRNVEEALTMIENSDAPMELTGNMLLLDREGNAARLESVGIDHQIFRHDRKRGGFFVAGNYPHQRADGMFRIGPRTGWAANTMLREQFLQAMTGPRQGSLGFHDVVSLMQTHEAGGMCQHIYDNPGQLYTSCSYIAVTRTGELWLSQGPPCQAQYVRHTLGR